MLRTPISIILVALSVLSIGALSSANSQRYNAVATTTTAINVDTNPLASIIPTTSNLYATSTYVSVTYVWTLSGDSQHCINHWFPFQANPGDTISGTITTNSASMVVYILSDQQYTAWRDQQHCNPEDSGTGIESVTGSYPYGLLQQAGIDWTATIAGKYWVVVETFSGLSEVVTVNLTELTSGTTTYDNGSN